MTGEGASVFVLRRNVFEPCIDMYPLEEWERMMEDIRAKLNVFSAKHVAFLREFCRGTQEVEMDGNGRVLLPKRILADVGIDKEMVFAAQDKSIQIWDADIYARVAMEPGKLSALAEEIFKG